MPEPTPHDVRRPSTDPAHAYDADADEVTRLALHEIAEDDADYRRLLVEAGLLIPNRPIPDRPTSGSSRAITPETQNPILEP